MRSSKTVVATFITGVALFAAGCGGGDSTTDSGASGASGASGSAALTKDEFITQADALCKTGDEVINTAGQAFGSSQPSGAELKQFVDTTLVPTIQSELDGIKSLTPPAGDEDQVNQIVTDVEDALAQTKDDPSSVLQQTGPFDKANQDAGDYGLKVCGQN